MAHVPFMQCFKSKRRLSIARIITLRKAKHAVLNLIVAARFNGSGREKALREPLMWIGSRRRSPGAVSTSPLCRE
jgi:hypothetical protein